MAASTTARRSLFRHRNYAKLWSAATVSLFGTQVSQIAIPFIAAVVLKASAGEVGLLTTIEFLPFILFTLPAGVWVDRFPKRRILVIGDLGRALMLVSIPVAHVLGVLTIWQLYVVGFVNGAMTVFFDVADQSFLPTILERDELVEGNAKLQISQSSAQILGQPVGGGLVALLTAPLAVLIDAASYVGSATLILWIRLTSSGARATGRRSDGPTSAAAAEGGTATSPSAGPSLAGEAEAADRSPADEGGMRRQIMAGLRYIGTHRYLAAIAASTATSNLFSNIAFAIMPVYLYRTLELSPATVGAIGGAGGVGVLLGALIASRTATTFGVGPVIVGSMFIGGLAGLLVPAAPPDLAFWFVGASFFVVSFGSVIYNVNQVSLRQAITPEHFLGRMNATMRFLVWGTIPIGSLIGAGLSEIIGVHETIWVGSILGVLAFLPVLLSPVRSLREIPGRIGRHRLPRAQSRWELGRD
ncbi:MAG TPA: MFS transporter, partial [Candidatus Deferrimicrobium sp.]|nr:MFS transporter [Candidatus Deferrimicrobium sp.]